MLLAEKRPNFEVVQDYLRSLLLDSEASGVQPLIVEPISMVLPESQPARIVAKEIMPHAQVTGRALELRGEE
jgi:hypothetical protein